MASAGEEDHKFFSKRDFHDGLVTPGPLIIGNLVTTDTTVGQARWASNTIGAGGAMIRQIWGLKYQLDCTMRRHAARLFGRDR